MVDNSVPRKTRTQKKIHKICRNDLRAFALRNYSESYKINKPVFGSLVFRRIMPRLKDCPQNFTVALEASLFIFRTILQPWALSSDIPAAKKGLFTKYIRCCCLETIIKPSTKYLGGKLPKFFFFFFFSVGSTLVS